KSFFSTSYSHIIVVLFTAQTSAYAVKYIDTVLVLDINTKSIHIRELTTKKVVYQTFFRFGIKFVNIDQTILNLRGVYFGEDELLVVQHLGQLEESKQTIFMT
ncbi:hypothetical protein ACJX0J_028330, partial [Zea mays]